ncbi:MAG TPA: 4'-phosphopantetheinyl transferase superfamily protein [Dermatophilaceae bacterium]|nr:4'-phosphopantetheinyl transferase superfamily protein [Dermatophilaceae bacterium]
MRRCAGKRAVAASLGWEADPATLARIGMLNRPGGAPYVEIDGRPGPFDVSLTDRAGWAVAVLGEPGSLTGGTIGVDVEIVEARSPAFVTDYLTPAEQDYVAAAGQPGSDGHCEAANLIWSAKESALKVLRVGLRADTRTVEVALGVGQILDGWAPLRVRGPGHLQFPGWWRRDGVYLLTLASRHAAPPPVALPGAGDLAAATPTHSWLAQPRVVPPRP